ncbi:hypothetical protein BX661DRAFT_146541 [Kickxella alabastrina]|uniref:uncharacterized protein n=1 Tax=Kickxella alabastrina TaxID=61397 RepID=UPI002220FEAF|nr:uncharacterized protein BX661DRAFT_146541 [Kickxella alabastrina]KAI7820901.1 hypothetical protein BX661DRAFT_146541 [Kickxella alabastrina]
MVLYFTSTAVTPPVTIFMGRDKFENEDLIKHGWPEDVWFHVDKLSSAHIYLRLPQSIPDWKSIPPALLDDLAQLCKANSIEGNKKSNITIIYTPWSNLLKNGSMAVGQVGFKNSQMVQRVYVKERENVIVNRLNKTKRENHPDLYQERQDRDGDERRERKNEALREKMEKTRMAKEKQMEDESYGSIFRVNALDMEDRRPASENIFGDSDDSASGSDDEFTGRYADELADFM